MIVFPDPRTADDDGLLCYGGNLEVETLVAAYSRGIFPWPQQGQPLLWFSPVQRGILDFSKLHWPRRFLKTLRDHSVRISFDTAFERVIDECAAIPRSHETGTWILPEMRTAYLRMHESGYAHSVEAWRGDRLVGGLYGVYIGGVFSGESMFHRESDASKRCLFALTEKLRGSGLGWMDIQMVTPVLETLGGEYISRDAFLARVKAAQTAAIKIDWSTHADSN